MIQFQTMKKKEYVSPVVKIRMVQLTSLMAGSMTGESDDGNVNVGVFDGSDEGDWTGEEDQE